MSGVQPAPLDAEVDAFRSVVRRYLGQDPTHQVYRDGLPDIYAALETLVEALTGVAGPTEVAALRAVVDRYVRDVTRLVVDDNWGQVVANQRQLAAEGATAIEDPLAACLVVWSGQGDLDALEAEYADLDARLGALEAAAEAAIQRLDADAAREANAEAAELVEARHDLDRRHAELMIDRATAFLEAPERLAEATARRRGQAAQALSDARAAERVAVTDLDIARADRRGSSLTEAQGVLEQARAHLDGLVRAAAEREVAKVRRAVAAS